MGKRTPTKWTTESFSRRIQEISPNIRVIGEYINMESHIECMCVECEYSWFASGNNLIRGTGCPNCARIAQSERMKARKGRVNKKLTQEEFEKRINDIDPSIEVIGDYKNSASKIAVRCKNCNAEWTPTANNLLQSRSRCPRCSKKQANAQQRMTREEFIERVAECNNSIEILGRYTNSKSRIKCRCKKCGNVWSPIADSLLSGRKCRKCSYIETGALLTKTPQKFREEMLAVNPNIEISGAYKGIYERIKCRCKICDYEWDAVPHYLLTGRGCPDCSHASTSFVEQFILHAFKMALGDNKVLSRDKNAIGKELDIYIPDYAFAIEPGSWAYHSDKYNLDCEKNELCKKKGIRLITVYYDYMGPELDMPDIICYSNSLALKKDRQDLCKLVEHLLYLCNATFSFSSSNWDTIADSAYAHSRRAEPE